MKSIAFTHIEKCAGTLIIKALRSIYGVDHFDLIPRSTSTMIANKDDIAFALRLNKSLKSIAGHSLRIYETELYSSFEFTWVTLLREPISRFLSDYNYHINTLGYRGSYDDFLKRESRRNFITKAICGDEHAENAIEILTNKYNVVGVVEELHCFLNELTSMTGADFVSYSDVAANITSGSILRKRDLSPSQLKETINACKKDIEVYSYVKNDLFRGKGIYINGNSRATHSDTFVYSSRLKLIENVMYRNLVYKPMLGRVPFVRHALPEYKYLK